MRKKTRKGDTMNTDIYIEYDEALADKVAIERLNRITLNDVAMRAESGVGKWIVKTGSWRKKCKELRYERPWSTTKTVFTATLKKPTYKKVK
jgi:hypothetical protein